MEALVPRRSKECSACLGVHDEETHVATMRVHAWFRDRLNGWLAGWREQESREIDYPDAAKPDAA